MSKRLARETAHPKRRKRKRNGISTSTEVLDVVGPSAPTEAMDIWHTNTEEPAVVQKSSAPIPKFEYPHPADQVELFGEALDTADTLPAISARPKRKTQNNSVSACSHSNFSDC